MFELRRFGIKLGLSTIRNILEGLGNPQDGFKCIHIAGTNGKGSIASTLAYILNASGYKTGLYTSPHLIRFNERICINNTPVSNKNIIDAYEAVKKSHFGSREPTFFEFATAMAFFEFGRQNVDWAVIETGMGGRLDATNIIHPVLSIISNISIEHKSYLGSTIAEITGEKAGIIKEKTPVITAVKQKSAIAVLDKTAAGRLAPLYRFGRQFRVRRNKEQSFTYFGMEHTWHGMQTGLRGNYQVDNAALVLAACEIMGRDHAVLPLDSIKAGLLKNVWPGRLEVVSKSPFIILDGAHNLNAARNLAVFLSDHLAGRKITLVTGMLDDKPYTAMLQSLLPVCSRVILTSPRIDRALPTDTLNAAARQMISHITRIDDVGKAVRHAIQTAAPDEVVCIAGSLYVVGEAKETFEKHPELIRRSK
ncbi:MAG: bifunctional folylpolyglutamate synthase/dihydrofolate synthase [Deltaproteobacteria bacterium]|nr:bifunctional folylpolyglutamate synthase/dihydrofolate synthase [Deltaproteobacteria bacterium]